MWWSMAIQSCRPSSTSPAIRRVWKAGYRFVPLRLLVRLGGRPISICRQGLAVACEHQAPGRVAVETMCQRGRARQAKSERVEIVLEGIAAFRPAMHGQSRRLVDHQHQPVAIEQAAERLFRCHAETAITSAT